LRELGLGRNNIGNDGAAAIVDALRRNGASERLDLSGNSIRDECAVFILKVLTKIDCSLIWLNLEGNVEIPPVLEKAIDFAPGAKIFLQAPLQAAVQEVDTAGNPWCAAVLYLPQEPRAGAASRKDGWTYVFACEGCGLGRQGGSAFS
jgi:Leucine Rich repeat